MSAVAPPASAPAATPDIVGNAFAHQYYHILHQSPELVHRFYQDMSKLGRPEENGLMSVTSTMQAINEKIMSLNCGVFTAETVDTQESYNGGVLVMVNGFLTVKDNVQRRFTQSFFLAPQEKGFFVLNDIFRYVDEPKITHGSEISANGNSTETSLAPQQDPSIVQEKDSSEQPAACLNAVDGKPSENGSAATVEEEVPVPEVVSEVSAADSQKVAESDSRIEEVPKKSYASILKVMKENVALVPAARPPPKLVSKSQDQQVAPASPSVPLSETQDSSANAAENGNDQNGEAAGPSVYVKGLPLNATPALLESEFKKFGPIKSDGIQVRSQKGFCFGFVEFEVASAVQSALEASPIMIAGRRVVIEEKRSTSRGNNRGRSHSGAGAGDRNDGARTRGNYGGGRGYGRGDFNNRSEFGTRGNRGGYANRGGDGYQRANGGGHVSRAGGVPVNAAAKSVAPRITATG